MYLYNNKIKNNINNLNTNDEHFIISKNKIINDFNNNVEINNRIILREEKNYNSINNNKKYLDSNLDLIQKGDNIKNLNDSDKEENKDNKETNKTKNLLLKSILKEKEECDKYEIPKDLFKVIEIKKFGNCLYSCISFYLYDTEDEHLKIRSEVYEYLKNNKDKYLEYFIPDNDNEEIPDDIEEIIDQYINTNNKEGEYGGDIELAILSNMLNIKIVILITEKLMFNSIRN